MRERSVASVLLITAFALTGCVAEGRTDPAVSTSPSASPSPSMSSGSPAPGSTSVPALVPVLPDPYTLQTAEAETVRIAGELVSVLEPESIVNDDVFSQEVTASEGAGAYWGVLHTLTLDPKVDAPAEAERIASRLTEAGWIARDGTNEGGVYLIALSSSDDADESWFVVVGADTTVPGQSVVTLQLASPTLR